MSNRHPVMMAMMHFRLLANNEGEAGRQQQVKGSMNIHRKLPAAQGRNTEILAQHHEQEGGTEDAAEHESEHEARAEEKEAVQQKMPTVATQTAPVHLK